MSNSNSKLSALAVFSELYDNNKDIYYILWEFSKNVIKKKNMNQFTPSELKEALSDEFGFDNIPIAVYQTMLRKEKLKTVTSTSDNNGANKYYVMPDLNRDLDVCEYSEELEEQSTRFSQVVAELHSFVCAYEEYKDISIENTIEILKKYLMGEHLSDDLIGIISEFVIGLSDEKQDCRNILNQIKEGFVIYDGICWSDNLNELGNWKHPITLYYDMDIIFYMAGYSGSIYKNIYDEMQGLIQEINGKAAINKKYKYINTMYFPDVRQQIDNYFECAEQIVKGIKELNAKETAMLYIVSRCSSPSDVQRMRSELDFELNQKGIIEDVKSSFYNVEQYINNIESEELVDKYVKGYERYEKEKVERCIKRINFINMLRNGSACDKLENCKFLLVTRNRLFSYIDGDDASKLQKQYPRVITPENITSKFWFQLNKGFGKRNFPKSLDVLAQAKIIIAHQVGKNLAICYDKLLEERKKGTITAEQATREIARLRQISTLPEHVSVEIMAEACNLSESSVEEMIERQNIELEEKKAQEEKIKNIEEENEFLRKEKDEAQRLVEQEVAATQEMEHTVAALTERNLQHEQEISNLKQKLEYEKQESLKLKEKNIKEKKYVLFGISLVMIIATIVLSVFDYDIFAQITTVVSAICFFVSIFIKAEKKLSNER